MKRVNKYEYVWKIWTNYGHGWQDECWEDSHQAAKQTVREYRENTNCAIRVTKARVLNPEWESQQKTVE